MSNILPVAKFVLIQFIPKAGNIIALPDGARQPGGEIKVLATGPDVPKVPKIGPGSKVVLRGDANYAIYGMDEKEKTGLVSYDMIVAVVEDGDEQPEKLPTDAEIDAVANRA